MTVTEKIELPANPTVVVTDSGLGGISVLADLEKQITEKNVFGSAKLIFFNAHAAEGSGYNSMKTTDEKVDVFDNALRSMLEKFNPDIILIACNTLSVIADKTRTYRKTDIPILGIVEFGTEMIFKSLSENDDSVVIVYGTPTTIESDAYRSSLISRGIDGNRIINQPCFLLETEIQKNAAGEQTEQMIDKFTSQAFEKFLLTGKKNTKCFGAFCCTHYGYSEKFFMNSLGKRFKESLTLNPNKLMSDYIISLGKSKNIKTNISVEVYSRVQIHEEEIDSIGKIIENTAPLTRRALSAYNFDPDLFEFNLSGK